MQGTLSNQADYLIFSCIAVAAFGALAWYLPRRQARATLPSVTWPILLAVLTIGWVPVERAGREERREIVTLVNSMAPTYALEMARLGHATLTLNTPEDDPVYQRLLQVQRDWLKANPIAADIYTMRKLPDGKVVIMVDSDTDYDHNGKIDQPNEVTTPLGAPFTQYDPGLEKAFHGEANFDEYIVHDRWGSWVGAWAPIYDQSGKVESVLGVDYDAASWTRQIAKARRTRIAQVAFLLGTIAAGLVTISLLRSDLHQRHVIEEELRRSRERLQLHVQQAPLAIIEWNTEAEVIDWNPAAYRIFGYARDEILGKQAFGMLVPPDAKLHVDQVWESLLRNTGGNHSVNENIRKDGQKIICEWFNTRIEDRNGQIIGVLSLAQDVTERRELEAQVQQSQKMQSIGQLAAGIAHDFNNILTIIQGHIELLLPRRDIPADAIADIQRVANAAERAANLTRQLLSFSRKQLMIRRPMDLNETIAGVTSMLSRLLGETIGLHCELAPRLPLLEADPNLLEQAVMNLALNSRDAMRAGGRLTIATTAVTISPEEAAKNRDSSPGQYVRLSVTDTGVGIPPEQMELIFEPFYTTKDVGAGAGLGLSAVDGIVRQHHGWIEVSSEVGKGTTVSLFLPVTSASTHKQPTLPIEPLPPVKDHTILIVEDEEAVRLLARHVLERCSYKILEAADGLEAEEVWKQHSKEITLLLTDLVLPNGVTGREIAVRFRREKPSLKVIYASGYSVELTAPDFCESRNEVFIGKPYLPRQLVETVRRLLDQDSRE